MYERKEAGVVPEETVALLMEERLEVMPRDRAERVMAGAVQARDMSGGVGAAIGDHQEWIGTNIILQEVELLRDAGLAVVIAAQGMSEDGDGAEVINDGAQA